MLWIILILVVAIGYEAFDAASRFAGMNANDTLIAKNKPQYLRQSPLHTQFTGYAA